MTTHRFPKRTWGQYGVAGWACGIYAIENIVTGAVYIGSASRTFRERWNTHKHELRKGVHANPWLQRSWNKHGDENFKFLVLEIETDKNKLPAMEYRWIETYRRTGKCYNTEVEIGKPSPIRDIKSWKRKLSESQKKRWASLSPEERERNKLAMRASCENNEERSKKISLANIEYNNRPGIREFRSEKRRRLWQTDEYRNKNHTNHKEDYSFVSPNSIMFSGIKSFRKFALEHGINRETLRKLWARKIKISRDGWTRGDA